MNADRPSAGSVVVFDLDGTLLDSDDALRQPFVELGIAPDDVTFGHVLAHECERLGISVDDYLDRYDVDAAQPFPGVEALLAQLDRWAVCSNKHPRGGSAELARLGWRPEVALFADAFDGSKQLGPVLEVLGVPPSDVVFVGDTGHDRRCALEAGVRFALAGWNPRVAARDGEVVLSHPADLLPLLAGTEG